jgi:hypothetical protein
MTVAYVLILVVTILANTVEAVAGLVGAAFMKQNAEQVGVPFSWLLVLGCSRGPAPSACCSGWSECVCSGSPPRSGWCCDHALKRPDCNG